MSADKIYAPQYNEGDIVVDPHFGNHPIMIVGIRGPSPYGGNPTYTFIELRGGGIRELPVTYIDKEYMLAEGTMLYANI